MTDTAAAPAPAATEVTPGFYWTRYDGMPDWMVSRCNGTGWFAPGYDKPMPTAPAEVLGRLHAPDEPMFAGLGELGERVAEAAEEALDRSVEFGRTVEAAAARVPGALRRFARDVFDQER